MASKQVLRLAARIEKEFGVTIYPDSFHRTYAGKWLKSGGAFTWLIFGVKDGRKITIGGFEPLVQYIKKKNRIELTCDEFAFSNENQYVLDVYRPGEPGYEYR